MTAPSELPSVLTADEVAALLRISRWQVYEMRKTGRLPALSLGRSVRFARRHVLELLGEVDAATPSPPEADVVELHRGVKR